MYIYTDICVNTYKEVIVNTMSLKYLYMGIHISYSFTCTNYKFTLKKN